MRVGPAPPPAPPGEACAPRAPRPGNVAAGRPTPVGEEVLGRVMVEMMREADADAAIRTARIRRHVREAAEARRRILRQIHRQARLRRRSRSWRRFKRFLLGVAAVVGAAAAIVTAPFTGGGSLASYVGAALGIAAAAAGAAGAAGGIAEGGLASRAELAGVRGDRGSRDLDRAMQDIDRASAQARDLVDRASGLEQRVIEIERREEALYEAATRRTSW